MADMPIDPGNLRGLIERGIREGKGADAFYRMAREQGLGVSRAAIREQFSEVRQAMINRGDVAGLPRNRIPGMEHFTPWEAGRAGRYAYQINLTIVDTETGEAVSRPWTIMSDSPISIQNAIGRAIGQAEAGVEGGNYANEEVRGGELSNLYVTT